MSSSLSSALNSTDWSGERTDEDNALVHPQCQVLNVSQILNAGYFYAISTGCWVHNSMYVGSFKIRMVEDKKKKNCERV